MGRNKPSSSSSSDNNQFKSGDTLTSNATDQVHSNQRTVETTMATTTTSTNQTNAIHDVPMGYPPPYQHYPTDVHPSYINNSYAQPHYYPNQPYTYPPPTGVVVPGGGARGGLSFMRGFLAMLMSLFIISCIASIVTWLVLRPRIPIFRIENLAISNFDTSSPKFTAEWDGNVTVENPNSKLRVYFKKIQGFVYHKEDFLSSTAVDPMFLATKGREAMEVRLKMNNTEQHSVGKWVVDEIAKERSGGAVMFNMRILVLATLKSGDWWSKRASMKVLCDDLKFTFVGNETNGLFTNGDNKPKQCLVYYV